jgi:carbon-monoxide dehydrogenase iron sulfur subunit
MVCPYGVVGRKQEERVAVKCDRCPDLDVPACVGACPTKALVFAEAEEFSADVRKIQAGVVAKAVGS